MTRLATPEWRLLEAFRQARADWCFEMAESAREALGSPAEMTAETADLVETVRGEAAFQIAEAFFMFGEVGIVDGRGFRIFARQHNESIRALLADRDKMRRRGLTRQRLEGAFFTEQQLAFVEGFSTCGLRLDQSSVCKIFVEAMAPETCRKAIVALAECGILRREDVGKQLVWSNGKLEAIYRQHLSSILASFCDQDGEPCWRPPVSRSPGVESLGFKTPI